MFQMHSLSSETDEKWSKSQHISFSLSLFIIIYSYVGLLSYVFNLSEARAYFWDQTLIALEPLLTFSEDSLGIIYYLFDYLHFILDYFIQSGQFIFI